MNDTEFAAQLEGTAEWLSEARAAGVPVTQAARAARRSVAPKLTAAQRRRVRELVEDEGETRGSAIAWVLGMEPEVR